MRMRNPAKRRRRLRIDISRLSHLVLLGAVPYTTGADAAQQEAVVWGARLVAVSWWSTLEDHVVHPHSSVSSMY